MSVAVQANVYLTLYCLYISYVLGETFSHIIDLHLCCCVHRQNKTPSDYKLLQAAVVGIMFTNHLHTISSRMQNSANSDDFKVAYLSW